MKKLYNYPYIPGDQFKATDGDVLDGLRYLDKLVLIGYCQTYSLLLRLDPDSPGIFLIPGLSESKADILGLALFGHNKVRDNISLPSKSKIFCEQYCGLIKFCDRSDSTCPVFSNKSLSTIYFPFDIIEVGEERKQVISVSFMYGLLFLSIFQNITKPCFLDITSEIYNEIISTIHRGELYYQYLPVSIKFTIPEDIINTRFDIDIFWTPPEPITEKKIKIYTRNTVSVMKSSICRSCILSDCKDCVMYEKL